jgi:hypothetical protein
MLECRGMLYYINGGLQAGPAAPAVRTVGEAWAIPDVLACLPTRYLSIPVGAGKITYRGTPNPFFFLFFFTIKKKQKPDP